MDILKVARLVTDEHERVNRERTFDELMRYVLHDINNNLTATHANEKLARMCLDRDPPDVESAKRYIKAAHDTTHSMCGLMRYARMLAKKQDLEYAPEMTGIVDSVESAVSMCSGVFTENKPVAVQLRRPDEELYFMGEPLRMKQVVMNILLNMTRALKDTPEPGIELKIGQFYTKNGSDARHYAELSITNNGPRLPFENIDDVFKESTTGNGSSGLGLAICRYIVHDKFKGKIYATHPDNGGVEFHIRLPILEEKQS